MMIDVHTHIIPFVDDGSENWETSLKLLKQGDKEGIVAAIATPHVLCQNDYKFEPQIIKNFVELKKRAAEANIKMKLYLGCEIYVQPDMALTNKISTINQKGKYFLVEFPMTSIPKFIADKFFNFLIDEKVPIIAHPERNLGFINKPMLAFEFVQRGALMQINAPSIIGKHGERSRALAFKLISNNLVHFVGSDCHHPNHRSMAMVEAYKVVSEEWSKETADQLFFKNAKNLINGKEIELFEPIPIDEEKPISFFQKLINFKRK